MPLIRVKNLTVHKITVPQPIGGTLLPQQWSRWIIADLHALEAFAEFQRAIRNGIIKFDVQDNPENPDEIEVARIKPHIKELKEEDQYLQGQIDAGGGTGTGSSDEEPTPPYYHVPTYGGPNNLLVLAEDYWLSHDQNRRLRRFEYVYDGLKVTYKIQKDYGADGTTVTHQYTTRYGYDGIKLSHSTKVKDF